MDEGGFVIDYLTPPGTSLAETHRQLKYAEDIIRSVPELESYSRRTGAQLGLFITEPNNGDFLLKLKPDRKRSTEEVISDLRRRLNAALPGVIWEFPGILGDLIGDLMYAPQPIEVKLFSTDIAFLKKKAPEVEAQARRRSGASWTRSTGSSIRARPSACASDTSTPRGSASPPPTSPPPSTRPCSARRPRRSSKGTASSRSG